jgi:tetratricopeptide (TPR) repeat protein
MSSAAPLLANRYLLLEEIGRGGHASVHRARDQRLGRDVAVKLLRDDTATANVRARFEREIRLTATLEHPHILHVHDTGEYEGRPFLVTELATGGTLADRLARESPLPLADALQITRDVGLALAHAHTHGVVHRDVKPANILLRDGTALLADFGVAFAEPEELQRRLTSAGLAVGTAQYMSPEQLCADPLVDGRADQYALALVLYELLAGVPAQTARTLEGLRLQRVSAPPLAVRTHRPSVPEPIDVALRTALAPVPADRFRDVSTFLAALGISASGEFRVPGTGGYAAVGPSGSHGAHDGAVSEPGVSGTGAAASGQVSNDAGRATPSASTWRPSALAALMGLVVVAGAGWGIMQWRGARDAGAMSATVADPLGAAFEDMTRVPVRLAPAASDTLAQHVHRALDAELGAWPDVVRHDDASAWQIASSVTPLGDSVRVRLTVQSADRANPSQFTAVGRSDTDDALRALTARLVREVLAGAVEDDAPGLSALPVRSLRAARAYATGHRALRAGALAEAEQRWRRVLDDAPTFAHAAFWAAQVASWRQPREREVWSGLAAAAQPRASAERLDTLLVRGLLALARADYPDACTAYRAATEQTPTSYLAWFGLGECQRRDAIVERRGAQLVHRGSAWAAVQAYRRAVETVPSAGLLGAWYPSIFPATFAEANRTRGGVVPSESNAATIALPSLLQDTLAFVPLPAATFAAATVPSTFTSAVRAGRRIATDLTRRWVERFPASSEGWLAHAEALELSGDLSRGAAGITRIEDAVARVRVDSLTPAMRVRTLTLGMRLAVRQGELAAAKTRARSVLADVGLRRDSSLIGVLAPLAAFVGDTTLLEATMDEVRVGDLPRALGTALARYHARAVLGLCNGLAADRAQVLQLWSSSVPPADTARVRAQAIVAADRLAVPCLGVTLAEDLPREIAIDVAARALAAGDRPLARRVLDADRSARRGLVDGVVSWDQLWLEAWLRTASADTTAAIRHLTSALESLGEISSFAFQYSSQAAGLRRSVMLLDSLLSRRGGSETPRVWADRVRAYRDSPAGPEGA